jgi:hypothetical protein
MREQAAQVDRRTTPARERRLGDERGRYGRRTPRDRAIELADWLRAHPAAVLVGLVIIALFGLQLVLSPRVVAVGDLRVGDCLYVPTQAAQDLAPGVRAIGDAATVEQTLMTSGAERADCNASHGHEVSAIVGLALPLPSNGDLTQDELRQYAQDQCVAAFPGFVGRALDGSLYETFAAVPTADAWAGGSLTGICLVARRDGQWMTHPARASAE